MNCNILELRGRDEEIICWCCFPLGQINVSFLQPLQCNNSTHKNAHIQARIYSLVLGLIDLIWIPFIYGSGTILVLEPKLDLEIRSDSGSCKL